ncbi:MAG: thioredoxin family protein [Polyangiaceae bacterium]
MPTKSSLAILSALVALGCGSGATGAPTPSTPATAAPSATQAPAQTDGAATAPAEAIPTTPGAVRFIADDFTGAMSQAKRDGKVVFVDAWAPWCHTCLSMDHFVFNQPSLARFESRVVFTRVDTEREQNGKFLAKYPLDVWPTLFVINPDNGSLLGVWTGAASLRELERLLEESLSLRELARGNKLAPDSAEAQLLAGQKAALQDRWPDAAVAYDKAVRSSKADWPRRSEALFGWIKSLHEARKAKECVAVGEKFSKEVHGAALPGEFGRYWFSCANGLPTPAQKSKVRKAAITYLQAVVEKPSQESSTDDIADAWDILADALKDMGDDAGFRKAHERRVALLEAAAKAAPSPAAAATFDYARAGSYAVLGRSDDAVKMLQARMKELPDNYEPAARLARLLHDLGRNAEARPAIDHVLKLAYGPRRMRYLELKANIEHALGNEAARVAALEEEIAAWRAIEKRQGRTPAGLADAQKRLQAAKEGK